MFKITDVKSATGLIIAGYLRENAEHGVGVPGGVVQTAALGEVLTAIAGEVDDWAENLPADHPLNRPSLAELVKILGLKEATAAIMAADAGVGAAAVDAHISAARDVAEEALSTLCSLLRNPEAEFPAASASIVTDAAAEGFKRARAAQRPITSLAVGPGGTGGVAGGNGIYRGLAEPQGAPQAADAAAPATDDPLGPGSPTWERGEAVVEALRAIRTDLAKAGRADEYGQHVNALLAQAGEEG